MNGMKLTGKCKEGFEKWYNDYSNKILEGVTWVIIKDVFYKLPPSMKYGVYVDFFDSVGIEINIELKGSEFDYSIKENKNGSLLFTEYDWSETRHEARTKAIEKANEIYNEKMVS